MLNISFCGYTFPLTYVTGISYTTAANCREGYNFRLTFRGYEITEISISMSITQPLCDKPIDDVLREFLAIPLNGKGYIVQVGDDVICPDLTFALTALGITPAADVRGIVSRFDIQATLSCVGIVKRPNYDTENNPTLPRITLSIGDKFAEIGAGLAISEFTLSPTQGNLVVVIGEELQKINSSAWLNEFVYNPDSRVSIEGYGQYYIANGSMQIGNELTLELSLFSNEESTPKTKTYQNTTLSHVLRDLFPNIIYNANDIDCSYMLLKDSPIDMLKTIIRTTGLLVSNRGGGVEVHELPETLAGASPLVYFIDTNTTGKKTGQVVIYDGQHKYIYGSGNSTETVKSAFCTKTDRSKQLLRFINYKQQIIKLTVPYDGRIRQHSAVSIKYSDQTLNGLIDDYTIDFVEGTIELTVCIIEG